MSPPLGKHPEVGLLGHIVVLFLMFGGHCILFSIVAALIYAPNHFEPGFSFLHTLAGICHGFFFNFYLGFFDNAILTGKM